MDYEKEVGKLDQASDIWKPGVGMHKVLILAEPIETEYRDEEKGTVTPQIKLTVLVDKEPKTWFMGKGVTTQSVYGQLMHIGKAKGKLSEEAITVVVNSVKQKDGKVKNTYMILEAVEIIKASEVTSDVVGGDVVG